MRRYLDGAGSSYLETTFSDFDARGNPETITDPNGRETTFTYDSAGKGEDDDAALHGRRLDDHLDL